MDCITVVHNVPLRYKSSSMAGKDSFDISRKASIPGIITTTGVLQGYENHEKSDTKLPSIQQLLKDVDPIAPSAPAARLPSLHDGQYALSNPTALSSYSTDSSRQRVDRRDEKVSMQGLEYSVKEPDQASHESSHRFRPPLGTPPQYLSHGTSPTQYVYQPPAGHHGAAPPSLPPIQPPSSPLAASHRSGYGPSSISPTAQGHSFGGQSYSAHSEGPSPAVAGRHPHGYEIGTPRENRSAGTYSGWEAPSYSYSSMHDYHNTGPSYTFHSMPIGDQPYQRKRRGNLPKEATGLLKEWFNNHRESPYPSEEEKQILCDRTGLSLNQVSNWFINARRRNPGREAKQRSNMAVEGPLQHHPYSQGRP